MDDGQKTRNRAYCKRQLAFTVRGERPLRRTVRSQRRQTLAQITTQLNDGVSRTQDNCTSRKSRLATGWLDEHSSDFSVLNCSSRNPDLNSSEYFWEFLEQGVKGHNTAPRNLTELWTALDNIWQVITVERFQKFVESMPRRVAAVIKATEGPTPYLVGIANSINTSVYIGGNLKNYVNH
ncbi:transposable element Tcb2 transposase [Trichonephila clavipes]|uniref:Transposable element Tcb2 transposase n=1 Tax=Trichonephila clavipes TaxID=2585209 RepID=A0A8X6VQ08_TRICX|nr:transposable element Tcb2 transposase [Trichonephila clavipes]